MLKYDEMVGSEKITFDNMMLNFITVIESALLSNDNGGDKDRIANDHLPSHASISLIQCYCSWHLSDSWL